MVKHMAMHPPGLAVHSVRESETRFGTSYLFPVYEGSYVLSAAAETPWLQQGPRLGLVSHVPWALPLLDALCISCLIDVTQSFWTMGSTGYINSPTPPPRPLTTDRLAGAGMGAKGPGQGSKGGPRPRQIRPYHSYNQYLRHSLLEHTNAGPGSTSHMHMVQAMQSVVVSVKQRSSTPDSTPCTQRQAHRATRPTCDARTSSPRGPTP